MSWVSARWRQGLRRSPGRERRPTRPTMHRLAQVLAPRRDEVAQPVLGRRPAPPARTGRQRVAAASWTRGRVAQLRPGRRRPRRRPAPRRCGTGAGGRSRPESSGTLPGRGRRLAEHAGPPVPAALEIPGRPSGRNAIVAPGCRDAARPSDRHVSDVGVDVPVRRRRSSRGPAPDHTARRRRPAHRGRGSRRNAARRLPPCATSRPVARRTVRRARSASSPPWAQPVAGDLEQQRVDPGSGGVRDHPRGRG